MKQIFFALSILIVTVTANAQLKKYTDSLNKKSILPAPKKILAVATQSDPNIIPLTPTILQGANSIATGSVKAKDLAIYDPTVWYDKTKKAYFIKCKVANVGLTSMNLDQLQFVSCADGVNSGIRMGIPFIHCGVLTDGGCGKSRCELDASHIEFLQDDGSPMMLNQLASKIFKPGQAFTAQNTNPLWGLQASYCGTQLVFKMVLDPPNLTGDQDLGNNILSFSVPAQY